MEREITPEDFASDTPPPRIIGTECEYSLQGSANIQKIPGRKNLGRIGLRGAKTYLTNGGRFYIDGRLLEYATPESLGPADTVVSDASGVMIARQATVMSGLEFSGLYRQSGSFSENLQSDSLSRSTGYHENYLSHINFVGEKRFSEFFPAFLASKVFDGQGTLLPNGFSLKQKIWDTGEEPVITAYTRQTIAGKKPMVILRTASGTSGKWRRVEIRCVDGGLSPEARLLAFGTTSLVLRLFEHSRFIDNRQFREYGSLEQPQNVAKIFARDLDFDKALAKTSGGKIIAAVDIQECFLDACEKMSEQVQLPSDEQYVLAKWREVIERQKQSNLQEGFAAGLRSICDNVALFSGLQKQVSEDELSSSNMRAMRIVQNWDKIQPIGNALKHWERNPSPLIDQSAIEERVYTPPKTRAARRAEELGRVARKRISQVGWDAVYTKKESPEPKVSLGNAY